MKQITFTKKTKPIENYIAPLSKFPTEEERSAFMKKYGFSSYEIN